MLKQVSIFHKEIKDESLFDYIEKKDETLSLYYFIHTYPEQVTFLNFGLDKIRNILKRKTNLMEIKERTPSFMNRRVVKYLWNF